MTLTGNLTVPHRAANVSAARHCLAAALEGAGVTEDSIDDAILVLSELVGNALRHAQPLAVEGIAVRWRLTSGRILVEVKDGGGATWPHAADAGPAASSGRGLHIVEMLALKWGVRGEQDGARTVWASLPAPRRTSPRGRRTRAAAEELGSHPDEREHRLYDGGQQLVG
jgi:anti-sigma regulatory factor (Ser/Thr protein kinase)